MFISLYLLDCISTYKCLYMFVSLYIIIYPSIYVCLSVHDCLYIYICLSLCRCMFVCLYMRVCLYMLVCLPIYKYLSFLYMSVHVYLSIINCLFLGLFKHQYNLTSNKCEKLTIQYTVLGFELAASWSQVSFQWPLDQRSRPITYLNITHGIFC